MPRALSKSRAVVTTALTNFQKVEAAHLSGSTSVLGVAPGVLTGRALWLTRREEAAS